ncbi:hypothetical protein EST38_g11476 [Candolleomyces aberdarensis]|uniref:Uncharacterized protein n=1 Tax=Candolleomyces aberdarensis TaxID=2316362 RepID=A0A4V1Q2A2_9AGAR|nr:hypothetical protein EST38_g11476 [Candolleomyces aberdarensis]
MKLSTLPPEPESLHTGVNEPSELATGECQAPTAQDPAQDTSIDAKARDPPTPTLLSESDSDRTLISQLRRDLQEAELRAKVWHEQADETRSQLVQSMTETRILKRELESTTEKLLKLDASKGTAGVGSGSDPDLTAAALAQVKSLTDELSQVRSSSQLRIHELWEALNAAKDELAISNLRLSDATQSLGNYEADILLLNTQLESTQEGLRVFEQTSQSEQAILRVRIESLNTELESVKSSSHSRVRDLQLELEELGGHFHETLNLAEARRKELEDSPLRPVDKRAATDIKRLVNTVNQEIFECAAYLSDVIVNEELAPGTDRQTHRETVIKAVADDAQKILGEQLAQRLAEESVDGPKKDEVSKEETKAKKNEEDNEEKEEKEKEEKEENGEGKGKEKEKEREKVNPLLVQIAMQIALTNWARTFARRWTSLADVKNYNAFLSELHNRIRDHEDQALSGLWRSLTRTYTPFSIQNWQDSLTTSIFSVMNIAGWTTRPEIEMSQIEKRLEVIIQPLVELRKAAGEDVVSADLEIAIVKPGITFDSSWMEDAYTNEADGSSIKQESAKPVIGATGIGLGRHAMKRNGMGEVQRIAEIWCPPKVVLEKTLQEALKEPRSPRMPKKKLQPTETSGLDNLDLLLELLGTRA